MPRTLCTRRPSPRPARARAYTQDDGIFRPPALRWGLVAVDSPLGLGTGQSGCSASWWGREGRPHPRACSCIRPPAQPNPTPPPTLGASGQQLVAKGAAPRRPWVPLPQSPSQTSPTSPLPEHPLPEPPPPPGGLQPTVSWEGSWRPGPRSRPPPPPPGCPLAIARSRPGDGTTCHRRSAPAPTTVHCNSTPCPCWGRWLGWGGGVVLCGRVVGGHGKQKLRNRVLRDRPAVRPRKNWSCPIATTTNPKIPVR